jgi:hypothetical protein
MLHKELENFKLLDTQSVNRTMQYKMTDKLVMQHPIFCDCCQGPDTKIIAIFHFVVLLIHISRQPSEKLSTKSKIHS